MTWRPESEDFFVDGPIIGDVLGGGEDLIDRALDAARVAD